MAPSVVLWLLFGAGSVALVVWLSLQDSNIIITEWAGLGNFGTVLGDPLFWKSALNSVWYAALLVPTMTLLPAVLALIAYPESRRWHDWTRIAFYVPSLAAGAVSVGVWSWVFHPTGQGLMNQILGSSQRWFLSESTGVPAISFVLASYLVGGQLILYLATLTAIPRERVEAARMDGASYGQLARYVLALALLPTARLVALMLTVMSFQHAETWLLLAPYDHTASLAARIYKEGFMLGRHGYASAESVVMIAVVGTLAALQRKVAR